MTRTYEAVPTTFNGIRYRSRLEAKWAAFMDALAIKFEYEPGRFPLSVGGFYVPDFRIPQFDAWLEVKPANDFIRKLERHKAEQFCIDNPGPSYWISNGPPRSVVDYVERISTLPEEWERCAILESKGEQGKLVLASINDNEVTETARIRRAYLAANAVGGFAA